MPRNELSFFLKTRYLGCLEWIHRPFLFYLCHRPNDNPYIPRVLPLAQAAVDLCSLLIPLITRHHRHGGIWGLLRKSFTCSLLLVAASKTAHHGTLRLPDHWSSLVRLSIMTIEKWDSGSRDLRWMKEILETLLESREGLLD